MYLENFKRVYKRMFLVHTKNVQRKTKKTSKNEKEKQRNKKTMKKNEERRKS